MDDNLVYHVYNTYDVLPKLNKISLDKAFDSSDIVDTVNDTGVYFNPSRSVYKGEYVCLQDLKDHVRDFIINNHLTYDIRHRLKRPLDDVVYEIPEDIVIHRTYQETDWLAYANVSFPSGWSPEKSVGKSFKELHSHIPGINLTFAEKMIQSCVNKGPFERFVWSLVYENKLDYHADATHKTFDETHEFFVKVERQVIVGIPEYEAFMFILRPYIIESPDLRVLYNSLSSMNLEQRHYKGISENLVYHLRSLI